MEKCSMFDSNMGEWNRERERETVSNDFNINQKFLSLRFLSHFLSFNKMYIHIFPIKLL